MQYRIAIVESEKGWGQDYWYEHLNTREEAEARIAEINAANVSPVAPDYYIMAYNEIVEVPE